MLKTERITVRIPIEMRRKMDQIDGSDVSKIARRAIEDFLNSVENKNASTQLSRAGAGIFGETSRN